MQTRALLLWPDRGPEEAPCDAWAELARTDDALLWIDVQDPSGAELEHLVQALDIDPRALDAAGRSYRRAAVRAYRNHYLVSALSVDVREERERPKLIVVDVDFI